MASRIRLPRSCYVVALSILLALFCFRVVAQLLQHYLELAFLPPFEAWHSDTLPYGVLLASQIVIVIIYAWLLLGIVNNRTQPSHRLGWLFFIVGLIYFLVMLARMSIGLLGLSVHHWFHSYLPTLFHFVLSGYLLVMGHFHIRSAS